MDKSLGYLSLARKAGLAELGEEPACNASGTGKAKLILVASDASDHTWRKAKSLVSDTCQQLVRLPYTKDEMGFARHFRDFLQSDRDFFRSDRP